MKTESVICSVIYAFITSNVSNKFRFKKATNVKYEIITSNAEGLCSEILNQLHQPATIISAEGAYSKNPTKLVFCVSKKENAPYIENLILNRPDCVVFKSDVSNTISGIEYK